MKKTIVFILLNAALVACKKDAKTVQVDVSQPTFSVYPAPVKGYVGDVMPFYDNGTFNLFYLQDWRDNAAQYHPWYKFTTTDLLNYTYKGQMIGYGRADQQDYTLGTGSVIKAGTTYYAYYTGHNYLFLGSSRPQEGIMYATSADLNSWTKKTGFLITPPAGYDFNNFRDPNIFFNDANQQYWMVVGARKNNTGVLVYYTTADLANPSWTFQGDFYAPGQFDMMECPDVFKWGNYWYLVFSDTNVQNATHYRYATSPSGPWITPANDLIDSRYFYAAKTTTDGKNRYIFGWVPTKGGSADNGSKDFAGNMSSHLLTQNGDGTLNIAVTPAVDLAFTKASAFTQSNSDVGVSKSGADYQLVGTAGTHYALFGNIKGACIIKGSVTFDTVPQNFGVLLGSDSAADQDFKFALTNGNLEGDNTLAAGFRTDGSVPFALQAGKEYNFEVVIESSIATMYIDGKAALSARIYALQNSQWGIYATNGSVTFKNLQLLKH